MRQAILFFVKFPEPGKVKTRLAATVGPEQAGTIYRRLVEIVLRRLPPHEQLLVMFAPPTRAAAITQWLAPLCGGRAVEFVPQSAGDLGARLTEAFAHAFRRGFEHVAVIGSDCPELAARDFAETWSALETHDCVLGPADDGGYYLLALKQPEPALFADIPWSTPAVYSETLDRLRARALSAHHLRTLSDVDTKADWRRASARFPELREIAE